ncbi:LOW QUALITY PROTEIN: C3 and PZP-like alpha-2-macroglobulin domain-containing protein 8 [Rhynchonycteris naso]
MLTQMRVPTGLRQALLKVWGQSQRTEEGPLFHNQTSVTVAVGASVFIQMDKPVYKPQHRVLMSVITITPDLRPINEKLEAYILVSGLSASALAQLGPWGSRMMEKHLEPVCYGIINMTFPLSDQSVQGQWFIFDEMQGHVDNKSFEVQKYGTFGKPISGTLMIDMTTNGVGNSQEVRRPIPRTMKIHSSQDFNICVRDMTPADIPEHFRGTVSIWAMVTAMDGSQQVAFDDSTPIQKQLVDVRYSKVTRKQFTGLSYVGMVELFYPDGSLANGVTVQIKAELTPKYSIYTTESVSRKELVGFEIPSIPTSAQHVWLETMVMALSRKPAGDQYLPSYLSRSWYSPSQCYLQLQPPSHPMQVWEEVHFSVKSTCPCSFTLYYEVVAWGNIVLSGQQPAHHPVEKQVAALEKLIHLTHLSETESATPASELSGCMTSLQLTVTSSVVPLSHLLVFYIRENGEGLADSLFTVETFSENQVSLTYSENETQPGEVVDLRVRAARDSCASVALVDKSVYLLRSDFRLTPAQKLEDYDASDAFGWEDGPFWCAGLTFRGWCSSFVFLWSCTITKDSGLAVTEIGLVVMTDLVSLNHWQDGSLYTDEAVPSFQPHTGSVVAVASRQPSRAEMRKRTFFPETWIWHCLDISDPSGEETFSVQVPDSIISWVGKAVGLSSVWDLGIAKSSLLKTFKRFFVDFTVPPHVVRGSQVKIPLSIYNYMGVCTDVYVRISVPKGTRFVGNPGTYHLNKKMCVASGGTEPTWDLSFSSLEQNRVFFGLLPPGHQGVQVPHNAHLPFPCPERVYISTPNKYEFQVERPQLLTCFDLAVRAHNDAHVALSPGPRDTAVIKIVLGRLTCGSANTRSWIFTSKMGEPVASTHMAKILSWDEFRAFWISWHGGLIQARLGWPGQAWEPCVSLTSAVLKPESYDSLYTLALWFRTNMSKTNFTMVTKIPLPKHTASSSSTYGSWQQQADGSFPATGRVLNKDIQGGIHGIVPLTACVVAALLEMNVASEEEGAAVARAQHFLESSVALTSDPYSSVLTAYVLTLLRSPAAPCGLWPLMSPGLADGVTHWSLTGSQEEDKDTFLSFSDRVSAVVSAEVEMTAYALLTYTLLGDMATALPVVKWLAQRNALDFSSTQDTCMALQALAEYVTLFYAGDIHLTVSLASTNPDYQKTFELHRANQSLQTAVTPSLLKGLFVSAKGEGCCLVQIEVAYNVPDPVAKPSFHSVSLWEPTAEQPRQPAPAPAPSANDDDPATDQHHQEYQVTLEVCTRWLHAGSSNMAVLEVPLLSGFQADMGSLGQLLLNQHVALRYKAAGCRVLFCFDESMEAGAQALGLVDPTEPEPPAAPQISNQCLTCVQFPARRQHVVGRMSTLPVWVYDSYKPQACSPRPAAFEATGFYNVSARCPLARDLCSGRCNKMGRPVAQGPGWWSLGEQGPAADPERGRCGCAHGDPVHGFNGVLHTSACRLQGACRRGLTLEPAPGRCSLEKPTPASAYNYNYDPVPLESGHLEVSHEAMDLEGETEGR